VADETETFGPESHRAGGQGAAWSLTVALDCKRIDDPPVRLSLDRIAEVEIGRGAVRAFRRDGGRLRIDLPDRWASQVHVRLMRAAEGWVFEDAGSKNGSRVNGAQAARATLADGDVVECGGTFLVARRAEGPVRDLEQPTGRGVRTISPALERELAVLPKIARSRVPVVVRGDSGTGKEVVASAIHSLSGRGGPLVAVNCGAIPDTLIESELFGSRRGAFSGAEDRPGLVRSAEGGTLFPDEFADLPPPSQAALLRVLQDGEVLPLGAAKAVVVDVRVVAATNRPVEELVADGRFRRDLYARLRGYEIRLPPLRARLEDLGLLIAELLRRLSPGGPPRTLSRAAARVLFLHGWPLNVRELEQVLRAAIAVASGCEIVAEDLQLASPLAKAPDPGQGGDENARLVLLLSRHAGNIAAVARELATSGSQVRRLLARHGLDADDYKRK
jgi:transcriptional regulator with PAS, ATPase and Fis domain